VDSVGRKIPLILGLATFIVATTIFVMGNFLTVMIAMALFGLAQLLVMSGAMALLTDLVQPSNRGKVIGFINFVGYIIMGLGMLLGGFLYERVIPHSPFILNIGVIVVALLIVIFLIDESKEKL
jgi:DHA2 family integral membrane protein (MFS transporter)